MNRRVIFVVVMAMILMVIGSTALATEKTTNQNGAFVRVSYSCFDREGNGHSPSVAISNVEVNKTSANKATVKIYFKASCSEDSEHNYDRVGHPLTFYLERTCCTNTMSDYTLFRSVYPDNQSQIEYEVYAYAEMKAGSHTWENGKCKDCSAECNHSGNTNPPTCTESAACSICGKTLEALGHDLVHHEAKAATCTEVGWDAYDTCKRCDYTTYVELPALGHDYSAKKVAPTCMEGGYTKHTCAVCGDSYKDQKVARLGHYYGLWHDNGDATHTASCVREGCAHQATVECHMFEYALTNAAEEEAATIEFCPVCGFRRDLDAMAAVEGAKLVSGKLSKGEIIVREALLPEGGRLMTIAFEYAGKLVQPAERMEIALPIVLVEGEAFSLLNPDGTETAIECVSDTEAVRVILEYPEEIDAEQVDPETNLVRLLAG